MKKIIIAVIIAAIAYFIGYETAPKLEQSDWNLAYEHWFETSSLMLENDSLRNDPEMIKDLKLAMSEIDSVYTGQVMQWPVICDQRDKLSDAIRCYSDNHSDSDILEYVRNFGINPEDLGRWCFSY